MRKLETPWDFVERYYPKYYRCNEIAYNDDLHKIKDGEATRDSAAWQVWERIKNEATFDDTCDDVLNRKIAESDAYVFERAIEGYIAGVDNWK